MSPEHRLMSVSEIITDGGRRRHWCAAEKLRIIEETLDGRESISVVARRNGVAPNLLYRWRRLMLEGESVAVTGDDDVTSNRQVREMDNRISELERHLGRKTLEVEILKEALERSRPKKRACSCTRRCRRLSGEPSRQRARRRALDGVRPPDRQHQDARVLHEAGDADLLPRIRQIAAQRPTYGYRCIAAILNRQQRAEGLTLVNHKRVYRIMAADRLLLARCYTERPDYGHDGVVVAIRSNLRWCSDGFVHTLKRDYVCVSPLPDAPTALTSLAGWIEVYNDNHPHSGHKMRSPREHRALVSATAWTRPARRGLDQHRLNGQANGPVLVIDAEVASTGFLTRSRVGRVKRAGSGPRLAAESIKNVEHIGARGGGVDTALLCFE